MKSADYKTFLEQAFVAPLRSVLIVDDDYPTFEEILRPEDSQSALARAANDKGWHTDKPRILKILNSFRQSKPPLIVDIHDGYNVRPSGEGDVAAHMHQSDLLVLDYSLDKTQPNDGTKAIEIVRRILTNDHFNLVVLHTNTDLDKVFRELLAGILAPAGPWLTEEETQAVSDRLGPFEDADEGLLARLESTIGLEHYVFFRNGDTGAKAWPLRPMGKAPSIVAFTTEAEKVEFASQGDQKTLALYLLARREKAMSTTMLDTPLGELSWSTGDRRWVRSDTGFIAFTAKRDEANLLEELVLALADWRPPPSRLFLAKMRAEIDRRGVAAESKALGNKAVLAQWYRTLLDADDQSRAMRIAESVSRHSDLLMADILPEVSAFAGLMIKADMKSGTAIERSKDWFKIDLANDNKFAEAVAEHNVFVCSKTPELLHLATGHIFEAEGGKWICLSPMCDLVPDRKTASTRFGWMQGLMPFIAVRLHEPSMKAAKDVNSNRFFFLKIDGAIQAFSLGQKEGTNPQWFNLYATKEGRFNKGGFSYRRLKLNAKGRPTLKPVRAKVIGQLRYEYALNLMNRLGASMTRVGLDFIGGPADDEA